MKFLTLIAIVIALVGCKDNSFTGGGQNVNAKKQDASSSNGDDAVDSDKGSNTNSDEGSDNGANLNSDDRAVKACLDKWDNHPFKDFKNYRKISASVQVLGVGKGIVDDRVTKEPALILITAAINILGETSYELLNPNGYYCLKVDVNVQAKTNVNVHCNAGLADSKVDVGVLSDSQPVGKVGVHVLSDVKVNRVGDCSN